MIEYVVAAWLTTCLVKLPNEVFCLALPPGKEFSMFKLVGPGGLWFDGKKNHAIDDWCVRNEGDVDAWVHSSYEGDKNIIRLGPGMVPCNSAKSDPIS